MQGRADCSWRTQRQHYIWEDKGGARALEAPRSSVRALNSRRWCMIVPTSQSPSLKWGPSVQQGNRRGRQSVYSDCVCVGCWNSVVISAFSSGPKIYFQGLVKASKLSSVNWKRHSSASLHPRHDVTVDHQDLIFTGAVTGGDSHPSLPDIWRKVNPTPSGRVLVCSVESN